MSFCRRQKKHLGAVLFLLLLLSCTDPQEELVDLPDQIDFNYHIRPILSQNCYVCHGPDESSRKGELRLDTREGATARLKNGGSAIVPKNIRKSILVDRITSGDPDFRMPPPEAKKTLSHREIALVKRWIRQGAEWKPHWAFIKPETPQIPDSLAKRSSSAIIDYLVDKELLARQLLPSEMADKNTLIRRVSYLLTGLPPSSRDLWSFLQDRSADAYEKMVDQYLSSPHFGERWARHWMDLVRYGESMGHEGDFNISSPWQYRDYLIRAFNDDVPYDQLVKEHLAGDMLQNPRYNAAEGFNESLLGTGYFFLGEGKHAPVNIKSEEADRIDNMIDVTAKTFQALTVACARCHDHKFDPIPTTDYYAMYGMIESARIGPVPARRTRKQEQQLEELKSLKVQIRETLAAEWKNEATPLSTVSPPQFEVKLSSNREKDPGQERAAAIPTDSVSYEMMGDFREGHLDGWYSDGWAFGSSPVLGEAIIDRNSYRVEGLTGSYASSRYYGPGIQGTLRSPNFRIAHDSVLVLARGHNSDIRIVVENFQVIQGPLYEQMESRVDDPEWRIYTLDMSLVKGRKAYIEILPGNYGYNLHLYKIRPEDYIEVQYVAAFNQVRPMLLSSPRKNGQGNILPGRKEHLLENWSAQKLDVQQLHLLDQWLKQLPKRVVAPPVRKLLDRYDKIAAQLHDSTHVIGLTEGEAVFSPVFIRGTVDNPGQEKVPHQFLSAIKSGPRVFPQDGSGRLAWAESVIDPDNPLTARVIVNRLWHHLFGRGLVETVDNFGLQGELPSHPQLLDFLALQMIKEKWSVKRMLKYLLMSQTFQRSTTPNMHNRGQDPNNIYLHHYPVRRLEAEAIRDGMLAVSGELDSTLFGPSIPVHLTDFMTGRGRPRVSGPLDGAGRRSLYTAIRRNFIPPMMLVFDMPIPFSTFGRRNTTNVPAQSLTLLNDPFVLDQSQKWALNLLTQTPDKTIEDRIRTIYLRAFSRPVRPEELAAAKDFLAHQAQQYGLTLTDVKDDHRLWADYCHTIFNMKEFIHLL